MSVLVVEFEVFIPCLGQARESAERFDHVGGQFWAVGRREIKMGDFTEARTQKPKEPKEPKENQMKRLLKRICVSKVDRLDRFIQCHAAVPGFAMMHPVSGL